MACTSSRYLATRFAWLVEVGILLDELGRKTVEQPEQIMRDQHLPVTADARTDADGGDADAL